MPRRKRTEVGAEQADLLQVAFDLIAEEGWSGFGMAKLAERSGRRLSAIYAELGGRLELLDRLANRLDASMLSLDADELAEMSPRERAFELIMRRFDAMRPYRGGLHRLARDTRSDPCLALAGFRSVRRTGRLLAETSGDDLRPWQIEAGKVALVAIYIRVFNVWVEDDTPDCAKTLAELDRLLRRAEATTRWFGGVRPTADGPAASPA